MSTNAYHKYKESGIGWIKEIPSNWNVLPLYAVATECDESNKGMLENNLLSLSYGRIVNKDINSNDGLLPESFETYQVVQPKDMVLRLTDLQNDKRSLRSAIVRERGIITSAYLALRPHGIFADYFSYLLRSYDLTKVFYSMGGGLRQSMKFSDIKRMPIVIPSLEEQKAIVNFLDREIEKIDKLILEQEKLVELLREKRQIVISNAVTKGLDSNISMKESGIGWIGKIPAHWEIKKIKWLSPVQRGASPRPIDDEKYFDDEGEYAWVRIADVSASDGTLRETTQQLSELGSSLSVKIEPSELFISIAGTVGKPCITKIKACIHDGFVYFPKLTINPKWLYRIFEAGFCYGGLGKMGTQLNLNTETIGAISVGLPPEKEMEKILHAVDIEVHEFDSLLHQAVDAIDLLIERRSALISASVTGQIDVRNLASEMEVV